MLLKKNSPVFPRWMGSLGMIRAFSPSLPK
jgi:hypothetical protein